LGCFYFLWPFQKLVPLKPFVHGFVFLVHMKILVIRFSSIGDIVLTTPVLRCLKTQMPEVQIHYCTKRSYKTILEANPYIDQFHFLEESVNELAEELKKEKFDLVLDLHNNLRTRILKFKLNVSSRSFEKLNWEKWLLVNLKIDKMPRLHIVDRYLKTVEHLAVNNDGAGLDYFIPKGQEIDLKTLPKIFKSGYEVYAIGGQHETKKMPLPKMKELLAYITQPLILLGGKEDQENGLALEQYAKTELKRNNVLDLCGKQGLNQSASIIQQANKVYTHDTGMMHVAAAFKKEVICIWGNTVPKFGMYPYQTKHQNWEVSNLSCRPCSKIGFDKCPKGHFKCMNEQLFA
jgi:ADP-heptose:LPS heptosyltransferase